jgi:hypothetical protein
MRSSQYERLWGTGLVAAGILVLIVVFVAAFGIARDPGGYYDDWVPEEGPTGPEAGYDWAADGLTVQFTDTSEPGDSPIERWVWDFGGGAESAEPNPSFRFDEEGEWDVTLEVVDEEGLTSKAEGSVEVAGGMFNQGEGTIGLSDLADKVIETVDRSARGGLVVLLVIAMFVVLVMVGGRLLRQGVQMQRPLPDRINVKLRPKELELAVAGEPEEADEHSQAIDDSVEVGV